MAPYVLTLPLHKDLSISRDRYERESGLEYIFLHCNTSLGATISMFQHFDNLLYDEKLLLLITEMLVKLIASFIRVLLKIRGHTMYTMYAKQATHHGHMARFIQFFSRCLSLISFRDFREIILISGTIQ